MPYYGSAEFANRMASESKALASKSFSTAKNASLDFIKINRAAVERANLASAQAQADQYAMNLQMMREANATQAYMMQQQMNFNAQQNNLAWERSQQNWNQTADYNAQQNAIAQQYNSAEAEKQRKWQEYMSNTSYQRAMEDMRKAGLNPILAYMQGGASTPVGSSGSISGASMSHLAPQMASVSQGSAHQGSVGSYSGALENTSNILASIGAIADIIDYFRSDEGKPVLSKAISNAKSFLKKTEHVIDKYNLLGLYSLARDRARK